MTYDATGCFHWCTSRSLEECTLTREESTVTMFARHIIVAIFAEDDSPLLGLRLGQVMLASVSLDYAVFLQEPGDATKNIKH